MIPLNVHQVIDKKFKNIKVTMAHILDIKKIIIKKTCRTHLIGSTTWVAVYNFDFSSDSNFKFTSRICCIGR